MKAFKAECGYQIHKDGQCGYQIHKDGQRVEELLVEPWDDVLAPDGLYFSVLNGSSMLLSRRDVRRLHTALGRWLEKPMKRKAKR